MIDINCKSKLNFLNFRLSVFQNHQASHGIGLKHFCSICNKGFLWEGTLQQHMNIHKNIKPYHCKECGKSFFTKKNQRSHFKHNHLKTEKKFKCEMEGCAGISFTYPAQFKQHMKKKHDLDVEFKEAEQVFEESAENEIVLATDFIDFHEETIADDIE